MSSEVNVDQLLVVNDHSIDDTASVVADHGAEVIHLVGQSGKGNALRRGVAECKSEIVVFLDADVENLVPAVVKDLVQPLSGEPEIQLVKGFY